MRPVCAALALLVLAAACERKEAPEAPVIAAPEVEVLASDELPGLSAPATGIAFWTHPNVAFNGLMIVASADGVVSYNIEDGNEVSSIPGVKAQGAAVSYLGKGAQARGLLAYFDEDASAFKIHAIDNVTRAFQPVQGEIPLRGAVRGFCFGRGDGADGPTLNVIQKGAMTAYTFRIEDSIVTAKAGVEVSVPDDARSCAVDGATGDVILARDNGDIHRVAAGVGGAPVAHAVIDQLGGVAALTSAADADHTPSLDTHIIALDSSDGQLHIFSASGEPVAIVSIAATTDIEAVTQAAVMGVEGANLGALYRDGVIALGVGVEAPAIRLIPVNGLMNALGLNAGAPVDPRGAAPAEDDTTLIIDTSFRPE